MAFSAYIITAGMLLLGIFRLEDEHKLVTLLFLWRMLTCPEDTGAFYTKPASAASASV